MQHLLRSVRSSTALVLLALLLLCACQSTPTVSSEAKPGQDFAAYHRFALLPLPEVKNSSDPGLMLRVGEPARKTVIETLTAKGFTEVERTQADFTVNVRGQAIPRVEVTDWGYSHGGYARGYMYPTARDVDVYNYEERTLAVEIYDERSKEQVWVGWIKTDGYSRVEANKVCEGLRSILAEFPPVAPAAPAPAR
jgi:hypothetical protein